jgi:hypothetical protein
VVIGAGGVEEKIGWRFEKAYWRFEIERSFS